jgi:hypothetical protein
LTHTDSPSCNPRIDRVAAGRTVREIGPSARPGGFFVVGWNIV